MMEPFVFIRKNKTSLLIITMMWIETMRGECLYPFVGCGGKKSLKLKRIILRI